MLCEAGAGAILAAARVCVSLMEEFLNLVGLPPNTILCVPNGALWGPRSKLEKRVGFLLVGLYFTAAFPLSWSEALAAHYRSVRLRECAPEWVTFQIRDGSMASMGL